MLADEVGIVALSDEQPGAAARLKTHAPVTPKCARSAEQLLRVALSDDAKSAGRDHTVWVYDVRERRHAAPSRKALGMPSATDVFTTATARAINAIN